MVDRALPLLLSETGHGGSGQIALIDLSIYTMGKIIDGRQHKHSGDAINPLLEKNA